MTTKGCEKMTAMRRAACAFIATLVLIGMAACEDAPAAEPLVIATASPGGPYLTYGQGLARILSRELGQEVTAQSTQGPAQNILLIERKQATLAFITMGVGLQAWNGSDWTKGTRYRSMRVMFPMYDTAFQFVAAKRLRLSWLDDLAGLRIGAGPRAGTGGSYVPLIFKALDIKANIRYGAWDSVASQLTTGDLDAAAFVGGIPFPALTELSATQPLDFIEPSAEHIAVIENREELMKAQSSAKETVPTNIGRNTTLPLHPGAARYYREIGIAVPA